MSQQGQWQVAGSAAEVYEKELVPAVFGPWAPCRREACADGLARYRRKSRICAAG